MKSPLHAMYANTFAILSADLSEKHADLALNMLVECVEENGADFRAMTADAVESFMELDLSSDPENEAYEIDDASEGEMVEFFACEGRTENLIAAFAKEIEALIG